MLRASIVAASLVSWLAAQQEPAIAIRSLAPFAKPALLSEKPLHSALPDDLVDPPSDLAHADGSPELPRWPVYLLEQRFHNAIDRDELSIDLDDARPGDVPPQRVVFRGQAATVAACTAEWDAMVAFAARTIQVDVYRMPLPDGPLPAAYADAAEVAQLLQHTAPRMTASGMTTSGGALRLGAERWRSFVRDQDVEVAMNTRMDDPRIGMLFDGARATLRVHTLPDDRLLLVGSWLVSETLELREQSTGEGQPSIDLPRQRSAYVGFAGTVADGGALVVAVREPGDGLHELLLVRARHTAPRPQLPDGVLLLPFGAWESTPPRPVTGGPFPFVDDEAREPQNTPLLGPRSLLDWLPDELHRQAQVDGGTLSIDADAAQCAVATRLLRQLVAAQLHETELRVSGGLDARTELVAPLCAGDPGVAFVGIEQALVRDFAVEIANQITAGNPVVATARAGLWSRCVATRSGAAWHIDGLWQCCEQGPLRDRDQVGTPPLRMQLVDFRHEVMPWHGQVAPDQAHAIGHSLSVELRPRR